MTLIGRRRLLTGSAAALWLGAGLARGQERLIPTPPQALGPYYPIAFPLDADNDLVIYEGRRIKALGIVTHVSGRVLDEGGRAVAGARIEIWQCDAKGRYHHSRDKSEGADTFFQGYGRTIAGADGAYRFRTIRPVPYPGRAPHIHFAVAGPGFERLVTQMYIAGEALNERDALFNAVSDPAARRRLTAEFSPAPDIEVDAQRATFDIVLARDGRLAPG